MSFKDVINKKQKDPKMSTIICSAALQDHFLKKFNSNIDLDFTKKKK